MAGFRRRIEDSVHNIGDEVVSVRSQAENEEKFIDWLLVFLDFMGDTTTTGSSVSASNLNPANSPVPANSSVPPNNLVPASNTMAAASVTTIWPPPAYNGKVRFDVWEAQLDMYMEEKEITDPPKKVRALLQHIGSEMFEKIIDWTAPTKPQSMEYDALITLLRDKFTKKTNLFALRVKFFNEKQQQGQSLDEYFSHITRLFGQCKLDGMKADDFGVLAALKGLANDDTRQFLMTSSKEIKNIAQVQELATSFEQGKAAAREIKGEGGNAGKTYSRNRKRNASKFENAYKKLIPELKGRLDNAVKDSQGLLKKAADMLIKDEVIDEAFIQEFEDDRMELSNCLKDYAKAQEAFKYYTRISYDLRTEIKVVTERDNSRADQRDRRVATTGRGEASHHHQGHSRRHQGRNDHHQGPHHRRSYSSHSSSSSTGGGKSQSRSHPYRRAS